MSNRMRYARGRFTLPERTPPMTRTDRLLAEQLFHDRQAAGRAESYRAGRADLRFTDADYLDHETWVRPAFESLGDVRGKRVLDYGCGHGMAAVVLARHEAVVTAFDLSPGYVREAARRAAANGVRVECLVANGEALPFPDRSFDAVWGCAILHHLDLAEAGRELRRVLRPGGVAVFCEPWAGNPVLEFARRRLPYPGKGRTRDERPLRAADLGALREHFPNLSLRGFQLLGMVRRVCWPLGPAADRIDRVLLGTVPILQKWSRYVVLTMRNG
jgi:SAM-dependent methyltransferase